MESTPPERETIRFLRGAAAAMVVAVLVATAADPTTPSASAWLDAAGAEEASAFASPRTSEGGGLGLRPFPSLPLPLPLFLHLLAPPLLRPLSCDGSITPLSAKKSAIALVTTWSGAPDRSASNAAHSSISSSVNTGGPPSPSFVALPFAPASPSRPPSSPPVSAAAAALAAVSPPPVLRASSCNPAILRTLALRNRRTVSPSSPCNASNRSTFPNTNPTDSNVEACRYGMSAKICCGRGTESDERERECTGWVWR
mmetsp:Transcript_20416/g.59088  ORF Transcript_20416/g.59088 Transcript_20416/m.59088 type:complete len:256 (-) Transcript_20416:1174-1941(-)